MYVEPTGKGRLASGWGLKYQILSLQVHRAQQEKLYLKFGEQTWGMDRRGKPNW